MRNKDILKLAGDPRFIPGIYNYCDRWCERCSFTSRCLTYAMEREEAEDSDSRDVNNAAFWRKMESILKQTREMITAWAEEQGIDLDSLDLESAEEEERRRRDKAYGNDLSKAAIGYGKLTGEWLDRETGSADQIQEDEIAELENRIASREMTRKDEAINNATAVLRWYQYQIGAKIMRGLLGSDREEEREDDSWQKDSDGSIKVALIGMDRSIMAWGEMINHLPDKKDSILRILLYLERLRQKTEQAFPNARKFIRPGFDEAPDEHVN
ncbi:MAG: hypothetical protein L0229_10440 [Blastocatellia bacterium]|nr:hypothetical protein [Blastocatellia bacterium]